MGDGACGGEYCVNDGVAAAHGDYIAVIELWWNEYVVYGGGVGAGVAVVVLYRKGAEERGDGEGEGGRGECGEA